MREMLQVIMAERPGAGLPPELSPHYRTMIEAGVSRKVAAQLVAEAAELEDADAVRDPRFFAERLRLIVQRHVKVTGGLRLREGASNLIALIGPTGVGKTTSIAKLAAHYAVREGLTVALITADTYRIAAPEQLRTYANIIGLPMRIVNEAREMAAAREAFRNYDLVLMDTAGGSPFNLKQIHELKLMLAAARPTDTYLVLSANTPLDDLREGLQNFGQANPGALIFSKLDETRRFGAMYSLLVESGLPLSYISNGQDVPDDIAVAEPGPIASLVMEEGRRRG